MPTDRPAAHVVVLAAGRGSRLGIRGAETPKWLLRVGDRTLADRQLEGVRRAGPAVASTSVVVGHAAEEISRALAARAERVQVIRNPEFAERNNWWSLLRALRAVPEDGPVVVLNADLLADPAEVARFVADAVAGPHDGLLAVDHERALTDESMKVAAERGRLVAIGKVGIDRPVGEYIGMMMARGPALRALRAALEAFVDVPDAADQWYEGAVARTAGEGAGWNVWAVRDGGWVEIDDDADFDAAERLVAAP